VKGSDPPLCSSHGGSPNRVGAPPGNHNAETHGVYSNPLDPSVDIDTRIADLNRRIEQLSAYIDAAQIGTCDDCIDVDQYTRLLALHGQLTSRLGRLLRDKQIVAPEENNLLALAINDALDQASDILGVKL
jgi:hypothetical protein